MFKRLAKELLYGGNGTASFGRVLGAAYGLTGLAYAWTGLLLAVYIVLTNRMVEAAALAQAYVVPISTLLPALVASPVALYYAQQRFGPGSASKTQLDADEAAK